MSDHIEQEWVEQEQELVPEDTPTPDGGIIEPVAENEDGSVEVSRGAW